jgi:tRNA threonylcarbamoyladenosine biosynthesis protein TsaB
MNIITIKTDQPLAEIGLYENSNKREYIKWEAHRKLSTQIHLKIEEVLSRHNLEMKDIEGVVFYSGPGSFTGLRIGASVANALAFGLDIPVISQNDDGWLDSGIQRIVSGENMKTAIPEYGRPPRITKPKK